MQLDRKTCYRAVASRDRRFEGRFFVGVTTTGIYCRPGCPAPIPKVTHVRFYPCAAAAEEAGFRPCLRCRPDSSPDSPAWMGTSAVVRRALRIIAEGQADGVEPLAAQLGIGGRHLRRLFAEHVGASPVTVAQTRRVHFARKLIDETSLPMTAIAHAAGFASVRRFNDAFKRTFRAAPRELRKARGLSRSEHLELHLPFLPPFDWPRLVGFLTPRAIPGVEVVTLAGYRRSFRAGDVQGVLEVTPQLEDRALLLRIHAPPLGDLLGLVERARGLFDLGADPRMIGAHLRRDPLLRPLVSRRPGLRVPGAWDPFEVAVRTILGQQVSVKGATTLAGRLVQQVGEPLAPETLDGLAPSGVVQRVTHLFPRPEALAAADLASIGLTRARAATLRRLAGLVAEGKLVLSRFRSVDDVVRELTEIEGIGPWTAQMIAMRALREPDAFPGADLGIRHALEALGVKDDPERLSDPWRPWRAYAVMHLWNWLTEEAPC